MAAAVRRVTGKRGRTGSVAVELLAQQVRAAIGVDPAREHEFHPHRKWRFDLALLEERVAIEIDGGGWAGGWNGRHSGGAAFTRHGTGWGIQADCEKFGAALELGWIVVRATPALVRSGDAMRWVEAAVLLARRAQHAG